MQFDFSIVDWSDDSSPFDQEPDCEPVSLSSSSSSWTTVEPRTPTIRFAEEDEVVDHIHRSAYTEEEINATWFRPHEFRQIRNQVQQFVYMLEQRQSQGPVVEESDTATMRGMEFRTTEGSMKRNLHKRQAYAAVLEEQERQWLSGRDDPDRIAASYQIVSCKCQGMALLKGIQDEHDIRAFVRSSTPCTTTSTSACPNTTLSNTTTTASEPQSASSSAASPCKPNETESLAQQIDILQELASVLGKLDAWAPPDRDISLEKASSDRVINTSIPNSSTDTFVWLAQPSKETETSCRRLAVLEDIKILSGVPQRDLWHVNANPAAA